MSNVLLLQTTTTTKAAPISNLGAASSHQNPSMKRQRAPSMGPGGVQPKNNLPNTLFHFNGGEMRFEKKSFGPSPAARGQQSSVGLLDNPRRKQSEGAALFDQRKSLAANSGSNSKSGRGEDMLGGGGEFDGECFEESPAVAMLQQIQQETYQINIGGKKVTFDSRDPIFLLNEPSGL